MSSNISGKLELTKKQLKILNKWGRSRTESRSLVVRAQIILQWSEGVSIHGSSRNLGIDRGTVRAWRKAWLTNRERLKDCEKILRHSELRKKIRECLGDRPRSGAPVRFKAEEVCQIVALACKKPSACGVPVSHWSARDLREAVLREGIVSDISVRTVGRILKKRSEAPPNAQLSQRRR